MWLRLVGAKNVACTWPQALGGPLPCCALVRAVDPWPSAWLLHRNSHAVPAPRADALSPGQVPGRLWKDRESEWGVPTAVAPPKVKGILATHGLEEAGEVC